MQNYSEYELKVIDYENKIDEEIKKNNGIFYTDLKMVKLMFENINSYINSNSVILDPCCGAGTFLFGAVDLGFKHVYGTDIDPNAIKICKGISDNIVVKTYDTISNDVSKSLKSVNMNPPDLIIGNPPYVPIREDVSINSDTQFIKLVEKSGNNLFVAAIYRALEMVKKSGIISYILPKNFLHVNSYNPIRKTILEDKKIISIVDIGPYFKNVRGEQIILTIANEKPNSKHSIQFKKLIDNEFVYLTDTNQNYYKNEILIFESSEDKIIYEKLNKYPKLGQVCTGYIGRGKSKSVDAISGKNIIKFGLKDINYNTNLTGNKVFIQNIYSSESGIIGTFAGNLEAKETVTVITDGNESICRYLLGVLHSRLCNFYLVKYCYNNSKLTMHTDAKYIKRIPIVLDENSKYFSLVIDTVKKLEIEDYLSDNWLSTYSYLNNLIYEIYGLNSNEIIYIENFMKKIQSKRWFDKNGR